MGHADRFELRNGQLQAGRVVHDHAADIRQGRLIQLNVIHDGQRGAARATVDDGVRVNRDIIQGQHRAASTAEETERAVHVIQRGGEFTCHASGVDSGKRGRQGSVDFQGADRVQIQRGKDIALATEVGGLQLVDDGVAVGDVHFQRSGVVEHDAVDHDRTRRAGGGLAGGDTLVVDVDDGQGTGGEELGNQRADVGLVGAAVRLGHLIPVGVAVAFEQECRVYRTPRYLGKDDGVASIALQT